MASPLATQMSSQITSMLSPPPAVASFLTGMPTPPNATGANNKALPPSTSGLANQPSSQPQELAMPTDEKERKVVTELSRRLEALLNENEGVVERCRFLEGEIADLQDDLQDKRLLIAHFIQPRSTTWQRAIEPLKGLDPKALTNKLVGAVMKPDLDAEAPARLLEMTVQENVSGEWRAIGYGMALLGLITCDNFTFKLSKNNYEYYA